MKKVFFCNFCNNKSYKVRFIYSYPPTGETKFNLSGQSYNRRYISCTQCKHWFSKHTITLKNLYSGKYMTSTYKNKISNSFNKIISIPKKKSDNFNRINRIKKFKEFIYPKRKNIELLDVGSGLGVFPYSVKNVGWNCTSIDPDKRSVDHIKKRIKVKAIHGEFMKIKIRNLYDIITFNKVLEHVRNPILMLKKAKKCLHKNGFIYIEVPDAEQASKKGKNREEFFIDHIHVFSRLSLIYMCKKAGFKTIKINRINEPSGKFTLFSFVTL